MENKLYYGFDVGGTKIEFGAFNGELERIASERVPTPTTSYDALLSVLTGLVNKYDKLFSCEGAVGIGIPGVEQASDASVFTANIPAAMGKTLRLDLEKALGRQIKLSNDANCFALSEAWDAALQNKKTVLGLILGTGFGGGIVIDGEILSGKNNVAGELGHMKMPIDAWQALGENPPLLECGCGKKGCLDNYLSGRGFELLFNALYDEKNKEVKKAIDIISLFKDGDKKATDFVEHYLDMLSRVLAGLLTCLDPDVLVLGGGLSNFDYLYDALPARLEKYLLYVAKPPKIIKAKYGDAGGVRGAAFLNIKDGRIN